MYRKSKIQRTQFNPAFNKQVKTMFGYFDMPANNLPLGYLLTVHRKLRVPHCQQCRVESAPDKIEASWGRCQVDQQPFVRAKTK